MVKIIVDSASDLWKIDFVLQQGIINPHPRMGVIASEIGIKNNRLEWEYVKSDNYVNDIDISLVESGDDAIEFFSEPIKDKKKIDTKNEYPCKAKRKDNGEWVDGFPFVRKDTKGNVIEAFVFQDVYEQVTNGQRYVRSNLGQECYRVVPETIRWFTGCADKYKKPVYGGDIVWDEYNEEYGVVEFDDGEFVVNFRGNIEFERFDDVINCCDVSGNIYDNPEMVPWKE